MKKENNIINTHLFLNKMNIGKVENKATGELDFKANMKYKIKSIQDNTAMLHSKINFGIEPKQLFEARFEFDIIISFENNIDSEEEITNNLDKIIDLLNDEISYLLLISTKSMYEKPLMIPVRINELSRKEMQ